MSISTAALVLSVLAFGGVPEENIIIVHTGQDVPAVRRGNVLSRNWRTGLRDAALEDSDYVGSGYDRGHLVPLKSVSASRFAWTVNRLEVIAPQTSDLNRGPWYRLEQHVRSIARQDGSVLVRVGTLYEANMEPLPNSDEPHTVPSHFWMHVSSESGDAVYLFPQDAELGADFAAFEVTGDDLAELRGKMFPVR